MKLRNKKTGEIVHARKIGFEIYSFTERLYGSIAALTEDWEDYKPKEPLIENEKIRKTVREWARLNDLEEVEVEPPTVDCAVISFSYGMIQIHFYMGCSDISHGKYNITELCGEDE